MEMFSISSQHSIYIDIKTKSYQMMMGQLSQRTLSVIAGKIRSHPEVQGHRLHNPDQAFLNTQIPNMMRELL